jgi:twitching motility protein PilT
MGSWCPSRFRRCRFCDLKIRPGSPPISSAGTNRCCGLSTLHTIDASKTLERIVGTFEAGDQQAVRSRLAASFRYFFSQRLIPKKSGGRLAILEVLKSTMRTREYLERGEGEGKTLLDAMRDGELDGMHYFDGELEKLVRAGMITTETAYLYATNAGNLRIQMADVPDDREPIVFR